MDVDDTEITQLQQELAVMEAETARIATEAKKVETWYRQVYERPQTKRVNTTSENVS